MNLEEKKISSKEIYHGIIVKLNLDDVVLPDGTTAKREYLKHPGGVGVVPITDKGEIIFVKQYRYPYNEITLEIPAGKRDKGEEPLQTGIRELKEETGATAEKYFYLGELYPSPGYTDEIIHIYAAVGIKFGKANPDEDEFVQVEKIEFNKAYQMVLDGELKDSKTMVGILKAKALIDKSIINLD